MLYSMFLSLIALESILVYIPQVSVAIERQNLAILFEYKSFPSCQALFMPLEHAEIDRWL